MENTLPFEIQCQKWLNVFNTTLYKCFKKIRVVNNEKKRTVNEKLLEERLELKKERKLDKISEELKKKIEERIVQIEEEIGEDISTKYAEEITETLTKLGGDGKNLNGSGRRQLWKILKKYYPKILPTVPMGKKDRGAI